jgi:hypothetical protein
LAIIVKLKLIVVFSFTIPGIVEVSSFTVSGIDMYSSLCSNPIAEAIRRAMVIIIVFTVLILSCLDCCYMQQSGLTFFAFVLQYDVVFIKGDFRSSAIQSEQ